MATEALGPSLLEAYATVPDPRSASGRRHPLPALLALATAAMLEGAQHRCHRPVGPVAAARSGPCARLYPRPQSLRLDFSLGVQSARCGGGLGGLGGVGAADLG